MDNVLLSNPLVAVVILNWNGRNFLEKFLPSVVQFSGTAKIIVADNHSTDDSVDFLKMNYPQIEILYNGENGGFAKGYNDALRQIKADYFVLLNSDVEVTENWIFPVIYWMEKHPEAAACQPKIMDYYNKDKFEYAGACGGFIDSFGYPFCRGRIFNTCETDLGQYQNPIEIFWATGACMFVRAVDFFNVHGFDDDYFAHMEEIDLCWRLKNEGKSIWVIPESKVFHVGGGTLKKISPRKTYLNFRNNLITFLKNHPKHNLVSKFILRLFLDGIAGLKFFVSGSPLHCWAVVKAHFSFYFFLGSTLKKRKKIAGQQIGNQNKTGMLNSSIVYLYYIKTKKYFSELNFTD